MGSRRAILIKLRRHAAATSARRQTANTQVSRTTVTIATAIRSTRSHRRLTHPRLDQALEKSCASHHFRLMKSWRWWYPRTPLRVAVAHGASE
jgi:hypothetical protein